MNDHYTSNEIVLNNVEKDINLFLEIKDKLGCTELARRDCEIVTSLLDMEQRKIGGPDKCEDNCPFKEGARLERTADGFKFIPSENYTPLY